MTKFEKNQPNEETTVSVTTLLVQRRLTVDHIAAIWDSVRRFCWPVSLQRCFSFRQKIPLTVGVLPVL